MATKIVGGPNSGANPDPNAGTSPPRVPIGYSPQTDPLAPVSEDDRYGGGSSPLKPTPGKSTAAGHPGTETVPDSFFQRFFQKANKATQDFASWYYGPLDAPNAAFTPRSVVEALIAAAILFFTLAGALHAYGEPQVGIWMIVGGSLTTIAAMISSARSFIPPRSNRR